MNEVDPYLAKVAAPGSPFEVAERDGLRQFVNAPPDLGQLIDSARRHGDRTFAVEGERRISFTELFDWRDGVAARLDIAPGDRVAICMKNRIEWMVAFLAIIRAGGVAVLCNSRGAPEELVGMIEDVSPTLVLADTQRAERIRQGGFAGRLLDLTAQDMREAGAGSTALPDPPAPGPDSPCAILFTSGTTGRVKGAVLTHRNLVTALLSTQMSGLMILHRMADRYGIDVAQVLERMPQQAVLLVYPLFHISGLGSGLLSPLVAGTKIVIMPRWDPREATRLIAEEKITQFTGVPTMMWDVLQAAQTGDVDLSSLTNIGTGGQALPVNLLHAMSKACPHAAMGTGYGMTECAGAVAMAVGEDFVRRPSAAGRVLPLVTMRIENDAGEELPRGETGEIVVSGPLNMAGYWNRPEDTAAVLSADGWLRTGDVGYLDEEGYVFIVDRKKDMVISAGENIYCAEVERVLGEIDGVTECAALGRPDERLGESLIAIVRADGLSEDAIKHQVGERLADYKVPREVYFAQDALPRNDVGKVDKIALRKTFLETGEG